MKRRPVIERSVPLVDMDVAADGRTVTAYAATFGERYAVSDFEGDYDEIISRSAFNRTLKAGFVGRVQPLFNHGRTIAGTPSDRYSMPLGVPVAIRAEPKGLLTVTRYAKTDLADEILELIREGAITAQSFRGDIYRSKRTGGFGARPTIERLELGLNDYGPAPFVVNHSAEILAVRSQIIAERLDQLSDLTDEDKAELARLLIDPGTPDEPADEPLDQDPPTPDTQPETAPDEAPPDGPSIEALTLEAAQRRRRS